MKKTIKLPTLPKSFHEGDYIFRRHKRYSKTEHFVEYDVISETLGFILGHILFFFEDEIAETSHYILRGMKKEVEKYFNVGYSKWKKKQQFEKEMKDILDERK